MAQEVKNRYSDGELEEFRVLIQEKIEKAQAQLELIESAYKNDSNNGTDDTSPTFKAFDEGSEVMSKATWKTPWFVLKIRPTGFAVSLGN